MWKLMSLTVVQSILLTAGQVLLKFALARLDHAEWTWRFLRSLLTDWPLACCGLCFAASSVLWMYIIKVYPLSQAYPLISLSYVFGMIAAMVFFHEEIPAVRWAGVALIMAGCCLVAK